MRLQIKQLGLTLGLGLCLVLFHPLDIYAIEYLDQAVIPRLAPSPIPARFHEQVIKSPVEVGAAQGVAGVIALPFDTCAAAIENVLKKKFPLTVGPINSSILVAELHDKAAVMVSAKRYEITKFNTVFYSLAYSQAVFEVYDATSVKTDHICVVTARRTDRTYEIGINPHSTIPYPIADWSRILLVTSGEASLIEDALRQTGQKLELFALTSDHWSKSSALMGRIRGMQLKDRAGAK